MSEAERDPSTRASSAAARAASVTEDRLTRLWEGAGPSHSHHVEAVAELRQRRDRERRRLRNDAPVGERVACERCKQMVDPASSERLAIPSPVADPVEHLLCSRCADEVQRGLLRLLAGQEPLPAATQQEHDSPLMIPTRIGWFTARLILYGVIALALLALINWLSAEWSATGPF
jgi:hypothetical protein